MGKKGKYGKQRKDRFYKLAKETGYRSRASFKLIQLNRKFEFLQKSRVLIDLCAAPGGWLQVAQQSMPVSSIIIGVDLVSIKQIPNVITLQEDITTEHCKQALKKQLKTWKADTILHDGAPNVGKSWLLDAFSQNQLTLSALKLATEMLVKGGWFITKVFRSKDYLSLIWVFKKLFKKVHVTKPQASRNESAEIFVVCQGYVAPDKIDPKFLDITHVFKDVENKAETKANILKINKEKQKAEGYEGDASVFSRLKASDFIYGTNHLDMLSNCNEIIFDDEDIKDHKLTTKEIKECCKDIKVLGKGDLRLLLSWRKQLREAAKKSEDNAGDKNKSLPSDSNVEEQELDAALKEAEELELEKLQEAKRKKKKVLKARRKLNERLNLKMIIKDDEPIIQEDRELFRLSQIKNKEDLTKIEYEEDLEFGTDPTAEIQELAGIYRSSFISYDKHQKRELFDEQTEKNEDRDSSDDDEDVDKEIEFESEESDLEDTEINDKDENPLVVDILPKNERVRNTVSQWFDKEDFANLDDNDLELELLAENLEKKKKAKKGKENMTIPKNSSAPVPVSENEEEKEMENEVSEIEPAKKSKKKKRIKLDPEGLALGAMMVQSKKMKRDILDNAYNRYASNDENLPDWFVEDEEKHYRKELPVTAEMVEEYKARLREINARPIRKVIQAKTRKKRRALRKMEKARKKAEAVTDNLEMGEKEKTEQLKQIYKKAMTKKDTSVTYVVAKKSGGGKRIRRPPGVEGRYKVVDKRMKKDDRKQKIEFKQKKKNRKQQKTNFKKKEKAKKR